MTGEPHSSSDKAEVFEMFGKRCSDLENFPVEVDSAFGALVYNHPVVCGGRTSSSSIYNRGCYRFDGSWSKVGDLSANRYGSTGLLLSNGSLWVMGGWSAGTETEIINFDQSAALIGQGRGENIPKETRGLCAFDLGDSKAMIAGGVGMLRSSYVFNFESNTWNEGPALKQSREYSACGTIIDQVTGKK